MRKPFLFALKTVIALSFVCALVVWVEYSIGWHTVTRDWAKITPQMLLFVAICILSSHMLRAARIYTAYREKFPLRFIDVCGVSLLHNTISFLLPMRLGELALPVLSKSTLKVDYKYSSSSLLLLRIFDAHWLLVLLLIFASESYLSQQASAIISAALITTPVTIWLLCRWLMKMPRFETIHPLVRSARTLIMLYLITGMIWIVKLYALSMFSAELGKLSINHAWVAAILADASALSPITGFANAGTFELAFTLPLLPLGYGQELLLSTAVNLHILILLTNIIAGAIGAALLLIKRTATQV